ncbi:MAG: hypothetical protein P1U36_00515 [Legionellaceae bacterium]|nr:hypothetical protein [Legionellaceae bacterium]
MKLNTKLKTIPFLCCLSALPLHASAAVNLENNNNPVSGKVVYAYVTPLIAQLTQQATYTAGTGINIVDNVISGAYTVSNGLNLNGADIQGYTSGTGVTVNTGTSPASLDVTLTGGDGITVTDNNVAQSVFLSVGDQYIGGIVFHVDETGQHGLLVSCTDQSTGAVWMDGPGASFYSGANSSGEYSGIINTSIISAFQASQNPTTVNTDNQNASVLATLWNPQYTGMGSCSLSSTSNCIGGFYLPSPKEANELSQQLATVNAAITNSAKCQDPGTGAPLGVAIQTSTPYWTSMEQPTNGAAAYAITFAEGASGTISQVTKATSEYVRAIRAF